MTGLAYGVAITGAAAPLVVYWVMKWRARRKRHRREQQLRERIGGAPPWWGK